jgi:hypothetical protein
MGWVIDIAAGVLRGAGKSDLADWLKDAPKKLGEEIGQILVAGQVEGGTISTEAIERLEALRKENGGPETSQPRDLEDEYAADLNAFVNRALSGESSAPLTVVAVRGFLHDSQCCAVWVIDSTHSIVWASTSVIDADSKAILFVDGKIKIYLLAAKTDEEIVQMNLSIERDRKAFIANLESDYQYMVRVIKKNFVTVEAMPKSGKLSGKESNFPISDRTGIAQAFRTLELALTTQAKRLRDYRRERSDSGPAVP